MLLGENGLTLSEAANLFPKGRGKAIHVNTLRRWIATGVKGIRLTAWRIGGTWYTTPEACEQFQRDCSAGVGAAPTTFSVQTAAQEELRRRGYGRTREKLQRMRSQK